MQSGHILRLLLATASLYCCLSPVVCIYEAAILEFLEEFRMRMCHPIPNLGLPALDPLELGPAETAANNQYLIDFTGSIEDFQLKGLSDFVVDTLKINVVPGLRSTIKITLPHTFFKSLYTAKGSLAYIVNLAGDGNAEASVKDFSLQISWKMKLSSSLSITDLQIELLLGDLKVHFENLMEEERIDIFLHDLINEMGVELLDDVWKYEQPKVVPKIEAIINNKLPEILQGIIGGGGGEKPPIFEGVEPDCKSPALNKVN
ncbi:PREDICTED: uncharacterized protein LOC108609379 [Drosophila arizonae]|uniref:Uncharacterized protein LOC108609379 n=1 Tax=Drosophila arizonae TaxID=7263 RepID=A0ABM1NNU1_DROAR|nr:PREDICTED: uncharacterized protein LOC108609379 [Drosophila arizonae]